MIYLNSKFSVFCEVGLFCWTFVHRKLNCNIRALAFNFQCFIKCKSNQIDWQNSLPNQSAIIDLTLRVYLRGCSISIYSIYSFGLHIQITNRFYFEIWLIDFFCYSADRIGNIHIHIRRVNVVVTKNKYGKTSSLRLYYCAFSADFPFDRNWWTLIGGSNSDLVFWLFDCLMLEIQWK